MTTRPDDPGNQESGDEPSTETFFLGKVPPPQNLPLRAEVLERGAVVGRYVILDRVGTGGMGVVYSAYDPELDRKVALKLLRPDRDPSSGDAGRLRLLREAQAIARLSHPNVVAVFDAGSFGDQVFVAMEFVEGWTLRQWLEEKQPGWREILERFLLAGWGVAAAHAAGLVHRDFKPDNVLLGKDGRVRVVDFGLARPAGKLESVTEGGDLPGSGSGAILGSPLTQWGVALGTPAYMAPEQLRGEAADARSDQFSFCVSLYEALYGERPFTEDDTQQMTAVLRGTVREEPAEARVPRRLRTALLRGLSADPERRHPSMEKLLHELEHDPAVIRRRWLAAAALILVTGAVFSGLGYVQAGRQRLCSGGEEKAAEVWNPQKKQAIHRAFLATRVPFAESAWNSVEPMLDGYTRDWTGMRRSACEATRIRGEQSEDLLDRRMLCLDQRLEEARALTALFGRADAQVVEQAVKAVAGLGRLESCADVQALTARVPLPATLELRARVEAVERDLARAKALRAAGKYPEGLALARQVAGRVKNVEYRPVQAAALYHLGDLEERSGLFAPAEQTLRKAVSKAEAAGDDEMKARAALTLLHVLGEDLERFDRAGEWKDLVAGILDRLARNDELRAEFATELGLLYEAEGRYPESLAKLREAVAIRRRFRGERDPGVAATIGNIGVALYGLGRYPEAKASFQEALKIQEAVLGPQHPEVGDTLNRIGAALLAQGRYEEAIRWFRRALPVREAVLGPEHRLVADVLSNLGSSLDSIARYEEAREYHERALEIRLQIFGRNHPAVAASLDNLGAVEANQRHWREALSHHRQALEVRLATQGQEHPKTALTLHNIGNVFNLQGQYAEALPYFRKALAIGEKALGAEHPDVARDLTTVGDIERRLGRPTRALGLLERALKIMESQELEAGLVAQTRFALAQTLWEAGGDRDRALRLARQAHDSFVLLGDQERVALEEVRRWLSRNERARQAPLG
jgi:eukaryotic-like serine/threonine-protein kinase